MAAYVDFAFYTTTYGGRNIPAAEFTAYAIKASAYIDYITMDRAVSLMETLTPSTEETVLISKIKHAVCAVAEQQKAYAMTGGGLISSEGVGSHSVSYATTDRKVYEETLLNAAKTFLAHTGLMYRGFNANEYRNDTVFSWDI